MRRHIATLAASAPRRIAFAAVINESYEIHYTDSLIDPDWKLLQAIPSATTNWIEVVDPTPSVTTRYYRILWNW